MKISLKIIGQFTDIKYSYDDLISNISSKIGEIEQIEDLSQKYKDIVVAKIIEAKDHPQADKLGIYKIDNGTNQVQVVAGDKSLKVDDNVAYIPPGTVVPATAHEKQPVVIESRLLRGEDSNGMLASSQELDFGDDQTRVLVLDTNSSPGTALSEVYDLDDKIIDIENKVLTHRADCFGHIGLAREIAGIQGLSFKSPDWFKIGKFIGQATKESARLIIDNQVTEACPRFTAVVYDQVEVKPSSNLIQSYLSRLGIRPINNVVDITNLAMILTGQPVHAYDYDEVKKLSKTEAKLIVRYPSKNEQLTLLDGKTIELSDKDIVIATDKQAIGLGGVMGGLSTEVTDKTQRIIIEAANFDVAHIRNTSMKQGMFTEAVTRFARGQDLNACMAAQNKINQLISESEVSSTSGNLIDQHVKLPVTEIIKVKDEFINHLLGISLEAKYMQRLLQSIELDVANQDGNFEVKVPSWRQDIKIAQDVVEEVGRLNGYDNIVNQLPTRNLTPTNLSKIEILAKRITNILSVSGAYEVLTYSGVSLDLLKKSSQDESMAFKIKNAISPQLQAMRLSLLPSLLEKVHPNIKQGYEEFAIFEIGKTHIKSMILDDGLPRELPAVAWVFSASTKQAGLHDGASYYQAKKYLSHLMKQLGVEDWRIEPIKTGDDWLDIVSGPVSKNRSGQIVVDKTVIGLVGEFNPNVKKAFKLSNFTAGFELNLERLLEISGNIKPYQPSSRYPSVEQDITFVVSRGETFEAVTKLMLDLFDINEIDILVQPLDAFAKETDKSNKNLTFRIRLQRYDRTMTTQEANDIVDSMVSKLEQSIKAKRI